MTFSRLRSFFVLNGEKKNHVRPLGQWCSLIPCPQREDELRKGPKAGIRRAHSRVTQSSWPWPSVYPVTENTSGDRLQLVLKNSRAGGRTPDGSPRARFRARISKVHPSNPTLASGSNPVSFSHPTAAKLYHPL